MSYGFVTNALLFSLGGYIYIFFLRFSRSPIIVIGTSAKPMWEWNSALLLVYWTTPATQASTRVLEVALVPREPSGSSQPAKRWRLAMASPITTSRRASDGGVWRNIISPVVARPVRITGRERVSSHPNCWWSAWDVQNQSVAVQASVPSVTKTKADLEMETGLT